MSMSKWPKTTRATQVTNLLARDVVLEVEDGLFPVRVGRLRGGGEADALVAHAELDVEERHEGLRRNSFAIWYIGSKHDGSVDNN